MKKLLKWVGSILGIYVVFVVIFETVYLGYMQPSFEEGGIPMLDIVTKDDAGNLNKRRLARFKSSEGLRFQRQQQARHRLRRQQQEYLRQNL